MKKYRGQTNYVVSPDHQTHQDICMTKAWSENFLFLFLKLACFEYGGPASVFRNNGENDFAIHAVITGQYRLVPWACRKQLTRSSLKVNRAIFISLDILETMWLHRRFIASKILLVVAQMSNTISHNREKKKEEALHFVCVFALFNTWFLRY